MIALLLDTETTGLKEPQPIEIAYLPLDRGLRCDKANSFHQRYKPSKGIEFGALATHNIILEDLFDCPASGTFKLPIGTQYLIGHNIDYDWEALGRPHVKRICTLALARAAYPQLDSHTIGALMYALFGNAARDLVKGAHSARDDVQMNFEILLKLQEISGFQTIEELYATSEDARIPKIMPFGKHKGVPIEEVPYNYMTWCFKQPDMDPYVIQAFKRFLRR